MFSMNDKWRRFIVFAAMMAFALLAIFQMTETPAMGDGFDCSAVTQIPQSECQALVDLYDATDGDNWTDNTNWKQTTTPCDWAGVTCFVHHVTELYLGSNNLNGTLTNLSGLTYVQKVTLVDNHLSGGIPDFQLPNLNEIQLSDNPFGGTIPDFTGMPKVTELRMGQCQLTGTIPDFSDLTNLEHLWIEQNQLSGPVPSFSNLSHLSYLELGYNQLDSLPDISGLPNLTYLGLDHNQLSGTIPDFTHLGALQTLILDNNQLDGSIPNFSNLPELLDLNLGYNHFSGSIPDFSHLSKLESLSIRGNRLEGVVPEFAAMPELNALYLDNNQFRGVLSASFCSRYFEFGDFGYNMLDVEETDSCVSSPDPDWRETQTVPPTKFYPGDLAMSKVQLTWNPIRYTDDGGYYEVLMSTTAGGPYSSVGKTASKHDDSLTVDGLTPGQTYYFVVRTFTPAHDYQQNDLTSENSDEVLVMLAAITTDGTDVTLTWTPATRFVQYEILYSTDFYFQPEDAGVTVETATSGSWTHAGAAADAANNYAYLLRGVDSNGNKSTVFNRTGEFTFSLTPGG